MNLLEIRTRTRNLLDELDVDNSHFSDDGSDDKPSLNRFINEALADLAGRLPASLIPHLWDQDVKNLSIGEQLYDMPAGWVRTTEIILYGIPARIVGIDLEFALLNNTLYIPTETYPAVILPYQDNKCKIFPPATSLVTDGFKHQFIRMPVEVSENSDIPELPNQTHQWAVDYAAYRAMVEDGDERAGGQYNTYLAHFGGKQ